MTGRIRRQDIEDTEVADAVELASDGTTVIVTGITVVSTTSATKYVVCSGVDFINDVDQHLEPGDIVVLTGTTGADGTYHVDSIVDLVTFVVLEIVSTSTGGSAEFRYPSGALKVGFDPIGLVHTTETTVQEAIKDLDSAISGGGITESQHKILRHLIHFIDNGPAEGFASGAYREMTGTVFPTAIIWYNQAGAGKKKIVEKLITWTGVNPTTIVWKIYDTSEVLLATVTDTISYTGVFETSRLRAIV